MKIEEIRYYVKTARKMIKNDINKINSRKYNTILFITPNSTGHSLHILRNDGNGQHTIFYFYSFDKKFMEISEGDGKSITIKNNKIYSYELDYGDTNVLKEWQEFKSIWKLTEEDCFYINLKYSSILI